MICVCILTESPAYLAGVTALLRDMQDIEIRGMAVENPRSDTQDCVFILFLDEIEKFETQIIGKKVVLINNRPGSGDGRAYANETGWGELPYNATAEELYGVIVVVRMGMIVFPASEGRRILNNMEGLQADGTRRADREAAQMIEQLTVREREILQKLSLGYQNKQIALALRISDNTVKFHISSIYSKLGAANRTEALRIGNRLGLISL